MKLSSRVILVSSIVLVITIIILVIVTRLHIPWLWPAEKWSDFWIALISGMIAIATIGAIATFVVERILKDIDEQRSEKLFRTLCEKEWAEFEQRLYYQFLAESAFSSDLNYGNVGTPYDAEVLAKLLENAPLSRWQQGLTSPSSLYSDLKYFDSNYYYFKSDANRLLQKLKSAINQFNRKQAASGQALPGDVNEDMQIAICLRLILEENEVKKQFSAGRLANLFGSPDTEVVEKVYKSRRDDQISTIVLDLVWHFRLTETFVPYWLELYNFVKEEVGNFYINSYISAREYLANYSDKVKETLFQNKESERRSAALNGTKEILARINKQKNYDALDLAMLKANRMLLKQWRDELTSINDKPKSTEEFLKILDELVNELDMFFVKMEAASDQTSSNVAN